jgi:energy-coupling factor transport system ATP-binding protein
LRSGDPVAPGERADTPIIRFEAVGYRYSGGERQALADIDLSVRRGEIIGIIGPTGAGKTTLCLALNGIVPQFFGGEFFGHVHIADLDSIETPTSRLAHHVGMVFEDPDTQITSTSVADEVAFALENLKVPTAEIERRVGAALEMVGLAGLEAKHPANLSGGQKQRLSIASALALSSDIIVLDEPTSQLDPIATAEVFEILKRLNRENGLTVVVASHASEELAEIADRILLIADGRIVAEGSPEQVFSQTAMLGSLKVRPPDIVRTLEVLARSSATASLPETFPVTLAAASEAYVDRPLPLPAAASAPPAATDDSGAVLAATGLTHVYPDGTQALRGVDLMVSQGEFLGIAGRNGSGKSTLVRHFLRLLDPTSGTVRVGGGDIAKLKVSDLAQRIGYISQNAHQQIFCDTVAKEVGFALSMMGRPQAESDARVAEALEAMDLAWASDRHPISLSRGDRLRVVIAAVLALEPQILIFDEPTTGQDWRGSMAIIEMLRTLNGRGKTTVLITHHLYLLPGFVERLVVMDAGRVALDGPLREVLYDRQGLESAGLMPPQTVRFAEGFPGLRALRPMGPDDLTSLLGVSLGAVE